MKRTDVLPAFFTLSFVSKMEGMADRNGDLHKQTMMMMIIMITIMIYVK
jgi:hypothetical protein